MSYAALYSPYKVPALIAGLIAILDQATKILVIEFINRAEHIVIVPGFFHLVHYRNTGAAWGMFKGQSLLLGILSVLILLVMTWQFRNLADRLPERSISLALIEGGIIGNVFDRLLRGEVVDFLHFFYGKFQWPAFNVADAAITCGVVIFVASTLLRSQHEQSST
ncbi:MAG: signal peptidase II [Lentisphaeria bacterium]